MDAKHEPANSTWDGRKAYQPLKLVEHGHFLDVVKQDAVPTDGSQLADLALE